MATFACNTLANAQKWKDQIFNGEDTVKVCLFYRKESRRLTLHKVYFTNQWYVGSN